MKESIGTIWITTLVITFMLIFVGYLTFMISYSDTVRTKNDILSIIEKRNGITSQQPNARAYKSPVDNVNRSLSVDFGTLQTINLYLKGRSYNNKGRCPTGEHINNTNIVWYGVDNLEFGGSYSVDYEEVKEENAGKSYYYCFTREMVDANISNKSRAAFYRIKVFYKFDLPILNVIFTPVDGKTAAIDSPSYCQIIQYSNNTDRNNCPKNQRGRIAN